MRLVLFDMMDTLVREPYPSALDSLFHSSRQKELFSQVKSREAAHSFECGEISEREFFQNFYDPNASTSISPEDLKTLPKPLKVKKALFARLHYIAGMEELLERLQKDLKVYTGLASNYSEWYENILGKLGRLNECDYLFFSCEMGVRKPERRYYEMVHEALLREAKGISEASQILFIDDRPSNIEGAKSLSWQTHLMRNAYDAQKAIEEFLKKNS